MLIIQSEAITQDARNHASLIVLISRAKKKSSRVQKDFFFCVYKKDTEKKKSILAEKTWEHGIRGIQRYYEKKKGLLCYEHLLLCSIRH